MGVALFTLGGTIAMAGHGPAKDGGTVVARLSGADLTAAVPGLAGLGVPLEVQDIEAVPSAQLSFARILDLVERASRAVRDGACGVVVTQGTDTLEETAFLADLLWPHDEPFVMTGAMRNPTMAGPDGPANLLAAAHVAAAPQARGLGALVVLNDEVHAARWVRKTHSASTRAFASPNAGPIGYVYEGRVGVHGGVPRRKAIEVDAAALAETRVGLHTVVLDDDPSMVNADGCDGFVVAGFGVGHVPASFAPVLGELAQRMPVVLTSRTGAGPVLRSTYGAVGSETDLQRRGLINGGMLDPWKARVLLRVLLASGADRDAVAEAFAG
ncbi:asparaginase [Actinomadura verrucosospora]|uniref:Asparaginase/glutaminase n=1 Tax=Actinomadura verrucosospora TaxID=46165 RepID=A0A7D4A625_ACTVE|nr:asparaginase [Actinomadura verrucosospora]QKG21847.1 Asparaginase/glutaminase [Actinomadura verrucosospora]